MEEQQSYQAVDLDKILLFLAFEEQRSIDSSAAYISPRRAAGYPWLSTYADEELFSFSADIQHRLIQPNQPMIPMPPSQLPLQRDVLFSPFDSDPTTTSSILEDIHRQGVFLRDEHSAHFASGYSSSFQDISCCDNHPMRHLQINQTDEPQYSRNLQSVSPAPHQDASASLSYDSFLPEGMFQSSNEFFLADGGVDGSGVEDDNGVGDGYGGGGDGCGDDDGGGGGTGGGGGGSRVLATPNSSLSSSSCSEDVANIEESSCHPNPTSLIEDPTLVVGSKRKLAAGMIGSKENLASDIVDNKSLQDKPQAKKAKKRLKEPRYAIQTRSEKDVLEDGYKWRKYGQKKVKNTPYPRSYYRCTYSKCSVKKTVERSCKDSGLVITTYQGTHVHPTPAAALPTGPAYTQSQLLDTIFSRQFHSHSLSSDNHNIGFELAKQMTSVAGAFQLPAAQL